MPRVKIDYIVSFSSEDPENPASNLLAWDVNKKKWLCSKGETSCSVVLQLSKAVQICSVTIGAYQSAMIEVLVGRSESPHEPFQVLVARSVFQSPGEARRAAPADAGKLRSFARDALAEPARRQRWDRLRLVATQPHNKHTQFGVSFVHVFSSEDSPLTPAAPAAPAPALPAPAPAPALPARLSAPLDTFSSDEDEFRPGELFAKHVHKATDAADTGAQIRQATAHALKNIPDSSIKLTRSPLSKAPSRGRLGGERRPEQCDRRRDSLLYTAQDAAPCHRIDSLLQKHNDGNNKEHDNDKHKDNNQYDDINKQKHTAHSTPPADTPLNKHKDTTVSKDDRQKNKCTDSTPSDRDTPNKQNNNLSQNKDSLNKKRDVPRNRLRDEGGPSRRKDDRSSNGERKDDRKRTHSDKRAALRAGAVSAAPHALLADVHFVLSGYENPERARLRTAALALGATAHRHWGPACTHLICAFPNTPKLRAVRAAEAAAAGGAGGGARAAVVVLGAWLLETARTRRRLPPEWFATEPARRVPPPPAWDSPDDDHHGDRQLSECDTDDEIERVRRKMKKRRDSSPAPSTAAAPPPAPPPAPDDADVSGSSDVMFVNDERIQGSVTLLDSDSCGGTTDEEAPPSPSGGGEGGQCSPCGVLPALFAGSSFSVCAGAAAARIARYLRAYGGLVLQDEDAQVEYVVCEPGADGGGGPRGHGSARRLHAAWLWRCHAERRLAPTQPYILP